MTRKILSYPLEPQIGLQQSFLIPLGALFLNLLIEHGMPTMYFEADTSEALEKRFFWFIHTGSSIPHNCKIYRGTVFSYTSPTRALHLYEESETTEGIRFGEQVVPFPGQYHQAGAA